MSWGYRRGVIFDRDTGEIIRGPADARTPKAERGWLRGALDTSGKVKTYTFDSGELVATTMPPRLNEQGTLFGG